MEKLFTTYYKWEYRDDCLINSKWEELIPDDYCGSCDQNKYSTDKTKSQYLLYSGLEDKNKNNIKNYDYIRFSDWRVSLVEFEYWAFRVEHSKTFIWYPLWNMDYLDCEVIGNMCEWLIKTDDL